MCCYPAEASWAASRAASCVAALRLRGWLRKNFECSLRTNLLTFSARPGNGSSGTAAAGGKQRWLRFFFAVQPLAAACAPSGRIRARRWALSTSLSWRKLQFWHPRDALCSRLRRWLPPSDTWICCVQYLGFARASALFDFRVPFLCDLLLDLHISFSGQNAFGCSNEKILFLVGARSRCAGRRRLRVSFPGSRGIMVTISAPLYVRRSAGRSGRVLRLGELGHIF